MDARVAVASSDGVNIDQHFGRADRFTIYRLTDSGYHVLEVRNNRPPCSGHQHDNTLLDDSAELIADCDGVVVAQIGSGAVDALLERRVLPIMLQGSIDEAFLTLIATRRFRHTRKRKDSSNESDTTGVSVDA